MKTKWLGFGGALIVVAVFVVIGWLRTNSLPQQPIPTPTPVSQGEVALSLKSNAFDAGGAIPNKYTCDGGDGRPPLTIQGIPEGTQSLAIIMYDPDAPGGMFVHWIAWNVPPETRELPEGTLPEAIKEGTTSFRSVGYQGPCPPNGTHRYIWRLYALRTVLSLENKTTREDLETAMNTFVITQTELMGRYTR